MSVSQFGGVIVSVGPTPAHHSPGRHPVQPEALELLHQVQAEEARPGALVRGRAASSRLCHGGGRRGRRRRRVVQVAVGVGGGGDAVLLQQLQQSQGCGGAGGGGEATLVKVLEDGGRRGAHVLTVPMRWQAERAKAANQNIKKRKHECNIKYKLYIHACVHSQTAAYKSFIHILNILLPRSHTFNILKF